MRPRSNRGKLASPYRKVAPVVIGLVVLLVAAVLSSDLRRLEQATTRDHRRKAAGRALAIDSDLLSRPASADADGRRLSRQCRARRRRTWRPTALDVRVAFGPLLSGDVKVESVTLVDPVIVLEAMADGSNNWTLAPEGSEPATEGTTEETATEDPAAEAPDGSGMQVSLDRVSIENGTLIYIDHAAGSEQRVESRCDDRGALAGRTVPHPGRCDRGRLSLEFDIGTGAIVGGADRSLGDGQARRTDRASPSTAPLRPARRSRSTANSTARPAISGR
jgi:uncharacterized protein involved in outer membrane biogenesis